MSKSFETFVGEIPKQSIVLADVEFTIPTANQEVILQQVSFESKEKNADHVIFIKDKIACEINSKLFPGLNFKLKSEQDALLDSYAKSYDKFYIFTSEDKEDTDNISYLKIEEGYHNDENIVELAIAGDIEGFKDKMCKGVREVDALAVMNDIRFENGEYPVVKESKLSKDLQAYANNEIFQIGESIDSGGTIYDIISRYTNHIGMKCGTTGKTTTADVADLLKKSYEDIHSDNFKYFNPDSAKDISELCYTDVKGNEAKFAEYVNKGRPWLLDILKVKKGLKIEELNDIDIHNPADIEKLIQYVQTSSPAPTIDKILVSNVLGIKSPKDFE